MLLKTPIHAQHIAAGAKMVNFGGWDMPIDYSGRGLGVIKEHLAVRKAAGLFDVSHMGEVDVVGTGALAFLQRVTSNDVAKLQDGHAQYSALPMPTGAPVDDIIVYRFNAERFLIVVNASNRAKDVAWLQAQNPTGCEVIDRSDEFALLALQGPLAVSILQPLTPADLGSVGYYKFTTGTVSGLSATIARTGYTGEDGFEIMVKAAEGPALWDALMAAGAEHGLVPAGLGARDTLRLEAKMCLYGNEIDENTTLIEAGLGWITCVEPHKGEFNGRAVLAEQKAKGTSRKLVGFEMKERGIARHGYPVVIGGQAVSAVTSGSMAPFLEKNIGLAYVPSEHSAVGTAIGIEIRGVAVAAEIVKTPFYKRAK
ncbi:MAG: glycine cleavage system aminomethyltransferase GcvT [Vicinamibacteria bacterium]|nr:glycine cleavage system aminomethyltransferase GcvT [Vicinamibacteria bacterium]